MKKATRQNRLSDLYINFNGEQEADYTLTYIERSHVTDLRQLIISKVIQERLLDDDPEIAEEIIYELHEHGFLIAYQSRCWCEGKIDGSEHTPGCSGIAQEQKLEELLATEKYCWSRGPRIGNEGTPYCKLEPGHDGQHQPAEEDGWGLIQWGKPDMVTKPRYR